MSPDIDDDRAQQIHDEQLQARQRGGLKHRPVASTAKSKKTATNTGKSAPSPSFLSLFALPEGGVGDIAKGVIYGLLPALILFVLLPDWFKLLAVLLLVITGTIGYLLGNVPA
jgi:hypothetical protein